MELQEVQTQPIDLSNEQTVNDQNQASTIQSIYSENTKEIKALKVDKDSQAEVVKFTGKSSKWISDYRSAKSKLDSFVQSSQRVARRSRRSIPQSTSLNLTQKEREAIWEMYKLFEEVEKERKKLVPEFQKIDDNLTIDITQIIDRPQRNTIETHLNKMNWTTREKVKYENPQPQTRFQQKASTLQANSSYWTEWNNNPFQSFMKHADYQTLIRKIKRAEAEKQRQQSRGRLNRGFFYQAYHPTLEDRKREKAVEQAKEEVAQTVALKFLEWMGQVKPLSS